MTDGDTGAPRLVLGPLLRYVGETEATIWVETDRACRAEILGHAARTFEVSGHHYALVVIGGLRPGTEYEYQVALDGAVRWPEPDSEFPPSALRTVDPGRALRLAYGSCRIAELPVPRRRGSSRRARERALADEAEHGPDAMVAFALDLRKTPRERFPDLMLLIGDQVYADDPGPATRKLIEQRRDPSSPPGYEVADFAEYCFLYREAWSEPSVRWLLSVVPTAMIFDDHDVHDDWNTSAAWRRDYQAKPWWPGRIRAAYMSYWIYQHLGNLPPAELAANELWRQVQRPGDHAAALGELHSEHTGRETVTRRCAMPGDTAHAARVHGHPGPAHRHRAQAGRAERGLSRRSPGRLRDDWLRPEWPYLARTRMLTGDRHRRGPVAHVRHPGGNGPFIAGPAPVVRVRCSRTASRLARSPVPQWLVVTKRVIRSGDSSAQSSSAALSAVHGSAKAPSADSRPATRRQAASWSALTWARCRAASGSVSAAAALARSMARMRGW